MSTKGAVVSEWDRAHYEKLISHSPLADSDPSKANVAQRATELHGQLVEMRERVLDTKEQANFARYAHLYLKCLEYLKLGKATKESEDQL